MISNIPAIMKKRKITVSALSKMTGLSRTTLTALNKSEALPESTKMDTLMKIATALQLNVENLVRFKNFSVQHEATVKFYKKITVPSEKVPSGFKAVEKNISGDVYWYEGIEIIKVNDFNKKLYLAYSGCTLGFLNIEILNVIDIFLLKQLTADYSDYPQEIFNDENSLNADDEFLSRLSSTDLKDLLSQIIQLPNFVDLLSKVSIKDLKKLKPTVNLRFTTEPTIYFKGTSDFSSNSSYSFNTKNKITINIVQRVLKSNDNNSSLKKLSSFVTGLRDRL